MTLEEMLKKRCCPANLFYSLTDLLTHSFLMKTLQLMKRGFHRRIRLTSVKSWPNNRGPCSHIIMIITLEKLFYFFSLRFAMRTFPHIIHEFCTQLNFDQPSLISLLTFIRSFINDVTLWEVNVRRV